MIAQVIEERLHAELEAGRLARGAQVAVFADGQLRAEVAVGSDHHGDPFAPDTASCLYCCSKVPLFTAVLGLIDAGSLTVDGALGSVFDDANEFVSSCTVFELLTQTGGVTVMPGPVSRFVPDERRRTAHTWLPESGQAPRGVPAYAVSEVGWLAALLLERVTGLTYGEAIRSISADALSERALSVRTGSIAVTFQHDPAREFPLPLLNEQTTRVRSQWNPALGWYASATALAQYGAELEAAWHGSRKLSADLVRYATSPQIPVAHDVGLHRDASYGLGFWTDLSLGGFGTGLSGSAFGHAAQGGTSFVVVDPERRVVIAGCMDLALESDTGAGERRAPLVDAILEVIGA